MDQHDKDHIRSLMDKACEQIIEHCDSVRIFVTKHSGDGTVNTTFIDSGRGNFYAQLGQVREWLVIQEQYQRNWAIKKDEQG